MKKSIFTLIMIGLLILCPNCVFSVQLDSQTEILQQIRQKFEDAKMELGTKNTVAITVLMNDKMKGVINILDQDRYAILCASIHILAERGDLLKVNANAIIQYDRLKTAPIDFMYDVLPSSWHIFLVSCYDDAEYQNELIINNITDVNDIVDYSSKKMKQLVKNWKVVNPVGNYLKANIGKLKDAIKEHLKGNDDIDNLIFLDLIGDLHEPDTTEFLIDFVTNKTTTKSFADDIYGKLAKNGSERAVTFLLSEVKKTGRKDKGNIINGLSFLRYKGDLDDARFFEIMDYILKNKQQFDDKSISTVYECLERKKEQDKMKKYKPDK